MRNISRRRFLQSLSAMGLSAPYLPSVLSNPASQNIVPLNTIPKSGEKISALGMGTWQTFAIEDDANELETRVNILKTFFSMGGMMIDSSPMYGTSERTIGQCLKRISDVKNLFSATKVWTRGWESGMRQMERSRMLWGVNQFDLMQIHNLLDYETHIATLKDWKKQGKIRYIGITTSHGRRHEDMLDIMKSEPAIDFVQFTYNILDRDAEQYLLPLAKEQNLAVIINMPFDKGRLFDRVEGKKLPAWARDIDCFNWAQFFLKFVISHPAVTLAIPATSRVDHMHENMGALIGRLPNQAMRKHMVDYFRNL